jgi:hypothetical protein
MTRPVAMVTCLVLGALWALRSLVAVASPDFRDPETFLDWLSVISLSLAFASFAPGMLALALVARPDAWFRGAAAVVTVAGLVAAAGNLLEDGVGASRFGTVYAIGTAGLLAGLVALTFALLPGNERTLAGISVCSLVGVLLLEVGGGLVVLVAWWWLALRLHASRFSPTPPAAR